MSYLGDIHLGDTIDAKFCTVTTTGAPTQLAGSPVISAYPGNSTTQLTAGITLSVDFDSVTGLNNVRVVATSGNGYAAATNYHLVITTGTVGGTSVVGYVVASFSVDCRGVNQILGTAVSTPATAGILDVNVKNIDNDAASASGTVTFPNATLASTTNITAAAGCAVSSLGANVITAAATATDFGDELASAIWKDTTAGDFTAANSIGKSVMNGVSLGTGLTVAAVSGAVGSVTGAVGSVTGAVGSVTGAVGSVTGNVGGNVTGTIGGLTAAALKDFFDTDSGTTYASAVAGSVVKETADNAGGSSLTVQDIVDGVWDEASASHVTAGTTGKKLADAASAGDPWATDIPGAYTGVQAGKVVGDALDAAVTSRMATYTQPTGFLAATFPSGTIANTTNITAGTVTTATNLTNAPTAGDFTSTMKTSIGTAVAASAVASVTARVTANVDQLGGVAQSLTDLKDFADTGYDPSTHKVAGVVLTDTLTTYTGNTVQTGDSFARIGAAGAGLTAIDLPNQTMDITGNITGNLSGSVGSVTGAVGSVTGLTASDVGAIKAKTDNLPSDPADESLIIAATDAIVALLGTPSVSIAADIAAASALSDTTATVADAVPADGTRPSVRSGILMLCRFLMERSVASTTVTVKKEDGSTTAMTFTLDDGTTPTSITRAT